MNPTTKPLAWAKRARSTRPWSLTPLDDRVELDRPQPGLVGGGDPLQHPRQRDAHRPEHSVVLRVEADRPPRQARLAQRPRLAGQQRPLGSVDSHQSIGPETLRLLVDRFLLDGFMHMAEVGTAPGMAVAVTVVPHPGDARLLVGGLVLGAVVGASFGVPLAVASSSAPIVLASRRDTTTVRSAPPGSVRGWGTFYPPAGAQILACRGPVTACQRGERSPRTGLTHHVN
jgi:hypothetical protein